MLTKDSKCYFDSKVMVDSQNFPIGTSTSPNSTSCRNLTDYLRRCRYALQWSFAQAVFEEEAVAIVLDSSAAEMDQLIRKSLVSVTNLNDKERIRKVIGLETAPFEYAKRKIKITDLPKDDERRLVFQALFLFVLRPIIPVKYETTASFLNAYPDLKNRSTTELEKLHLTANWMDLCFHVLNPRNNKTFVLNLIPRIVEGRGTRYVTGSGQTKATTDRVTLFRSEGQCEKVMRPIWKKKEANDMPPLLNTPNSSLHGLWPMSNCEFVTPLFLQPNYQSESLLNGGHQLTASTLFRCQYPTTSTLSSPLLTTRRHHGHHGGGGGDGRMDDNFLLQSHSNHLLPDLQLLCTSTSLSMHAYQSQQVLLPSLASRHYGISSSSSASSPTDGCDSDGALQSYQPTAASELVYTPIAPTSWTKSKSDTPLSGGDDADVVSQTEIRHFDCSCIPDSLYAVSGVPNTSLGTNKRQRVDSGNFTESSDGLAMLSVIATLELQK